MACLFDDWERSYSDADIEDDDQRTRAELSFEIWEEIQNHLRLGRRREKGSAPEKDDRRCDESLGNNDPAEIGVSGHENRPEFGGHLQDESIIGTLKR